MELAFSRVSIALLALVATGMLFALWHLWLERARWGVKLLVVGLYFGLLALAVRILRGLAGVE